MYILVIYVPSFFNDRPGNFSFKGGKVACPYVEYNLAKFESDKIRRESVKCGNKKATGRVVTPSKKGLRLRDYGSYWFVFSERCVLATLVQVFIFYT